MNPLLPYHATIATTSTCPHCGKHPTLLSPRDMGPPAPAFYICRCGFMGQIGLGPIPTPDPVEEG